MITPDEHSTVLATGPSSEIGAFLDAAAAGRPFESAAALDGSFVRAIGEILRAAAGTAEITLAGPLSYSTHRFTLARGGTLRRSQGLSAHTEIAAVPTGVLPGVLLRLASIAPVEPLSSAVTLELPPGTLVDLFAVETGPRTAAWSAVTAAAQSLPGAELAELEQTEPRAAQLVRHRPGGGADRTSLVILLRGRYLVPAAAGADSLHGTDATGATRALLSGMLRPAA